jgi:hypothetical protein
MPYYFGLGLRSASAWGSVKVFGLNIFYLRFIQIKEKIFDSKPEGLDLDCV